MFFESLSFTKMKATPRWELPSFLPRGLSAEVERLDDGAVALDVDLTEHLKSNKHDFGTQRALLRLVGPKSCLLLLRCSVRWLIRYENNAIWLSGEPVSVLDLPYWPKSSCFFSAVK